MGLTDVVGEVLSAPGDLATFTGGQALPSPFSLLTRSVYPIKIGDVKMPGNTMIQVKGRKNIVVTEIPGGDGTVKEQVSHPDYEVTIEGVYTEKNNKTVLRQLDLLVALWNKKESIPIVCPYTEKFNIKRIVITNIEPTLRKGFQSTIWFKIDALSDNSTYLELETKRNALDGLRRLIGL